MGMDKEKVLAFIKANPGCKNVSIAGHLGVQSSGRDLDRVLQSLRKRGLISYRAGWVAPEVKP